MVWEVLSVVNEEGPTILGPYQTEHMAAWRAEQDRVRLARIGYDLVWYTIREVQNGLGARQGSEDRDIH